MSVFTPRFRTSLRIGREENARSRHDRGGELRSTCHADSKWSCHGVSREAPEGTTAPVAAGALPHGSWPVGRPDALDGRIEAGLVGPVGVRQPTGSRPET